MLVWSPLEQNIYDIHSIAKVSVHSPTLKKESRSTVPTVLVISRRTGPFYKPGAGIIIQTTSHHPPAGRSSVQMSTIMPKLSFKPQYPWAESPAPRGSSRHRRNLLRDEEQGGLKILHPNLVQELHQTNDNKQTNKKSDQQKQKGKKKNQQPKA